MRLKAARADTAADREAKRAFFCAAGLIGIAVILGGGGVRYGLANLAVQLAALLVLALNREAFFRFWREAPFALKALVLSSAALPFLHTLPLPPAVWTALPGREAMAQSLSATGADGSWAPLSMDRARSLVALSGLIVPLTVLSIGWSIPERRLALLGWIVALLGIANVLIGVPQVLSDGATGVFYPENPMPGVLFGSFANRNSAGIFLVSALACAALLPAPSAHPAGLFVRLSVCLLLIVGVLLTRSRTALVLAVIPVLLGLARAFWLNRASSKAAERRSPETKPAPRVIAAALIALIIAAGIGISAGPGAGSSGRIADTLSRFEATSDARAYIWEDAAYSAGRYWPVGSGMGTFDEVFQLDESLENTTLRKAGRAHNDYIEIAIEAGLPGLALIAAWALLCGYMVVRVIRSGRRGHLNSRWMGYTGAAILLAIALQSIADYPLRNQAMLAAVSFALLLLARASSIARGNPAR